MMTDEQKILTLNRAGKTRKALHHLMNLYGDDVYTFAASMLQNEEDAADATQEIFLKAWRHLDGFRGDASLKSWLLTITRNTCLSVLDSRARQISRDDFQTADIPADENGTGPQADLRPMLNRLPENQKTPLLLYHYMNCRYEEIAGILNLPVNTVKARIRRGRMALGKMMNAEDFGYAL